MRSVGGDNMTKRELGEKIKAILDKDGDGIIEPHEILQEVTSIVIDLIQLKKLIKG
jgi:hypothetical protein